jgi:hypothetical protein
MPGEVGILTCFEKKSKQPARRRKNAMSEKL